MSGVIDTFGSLKAWEPPTTLDIIGRGILQPGTRMIYFGGPGSWKSNLAIHTAFTLATGRGWFGFETTRCVVYKIQIELPKAQDKKRIMKYSNSVFNETGSQFLAEPNNIYFKTDNHLKLDTAVGLKYLEQDLLNIRDRHPNDLMVLILDPMYKLVSGHIEDSYECQKLLDNLDYMMPRHNIAIILVHHARKSRIGADGRIIDLGGEESTGSRYISNWCDTMAQCTLLNPKSGKDRVRMEFVKTRNAEEQLPIFQVQWHRATLLPEVVRVDMEIPDDPSDIRELGE